MRGGGAINITPGRTGFHDRDTPLGVDLHAAHQRKVDHHAAVGHGVPGNAVSATAHRDLGAGGYGVTHRRHDVVAGAAPQDDTWPLVDQTVEDLSRLVVVGGVRVDRLADEVRHRGGREWHRFLRVLQA